MRRQILALTAAALLLPAALAACSSSPSKPSTGSPSAASGTAAGLPTVTGAFGTQPAVAVPSGSAPKTLQVSVLSKGDGPAVAKGQLVVIDYVGEVWASKKVFDTSFGTGRSPASFTIGTGQVIAGFDEGVIGKPVGSRVLLVIPPDKGYGSTGNSNVGIKGTDTLVFVVDIRGAHNGDETAAGTPVAPPGPGLPTVSTAKGKPTISVPSGPAPTKLVVKTVLQGSGETVRAGDLLVVQYVGVKWAGGKTFDTSWDRGSPAGFAIGVGQVIPGWDQGLVGRKVGDRVLLVVPPAEGYGAQGQSGAGITATDTLVFAVDIVATYH